MRRPRGRLFRDDSVRGYYRRFLSLCAKTGVAIKPYLTTADYERLTRTRFGTLGEAEQFRSIYIETRYGEKPADRDGIRRMKELLASFRKG
jgi:hypothetical protein